jgi:hypothetical protein
VLKLRPSRLVVTVAALLCVSLGSASAFTIRGTGTGSLIGGDLTDPENDGLPDTDQNYNATFSSSEEPGFGGGEFAFNVFDNLTTGGGNNKWCCGDQNNFPVNPISIDATFTQRFVLTQFTITSGNDTPTRDPRAWQILGSNDGTTFTPIFTQNDLNASLWGTVRDEVLEFDSGTDFPAPAAYSTFRFQTTATGATTGARFQLAELEYFGTPVPEPSAIAFLSVATVIAASTRRRREFSHAVSPTRAQS